MAASLLFSIHQWFAWVVVGSNAAAGLWALVAHWREDLRTRSMWLTVAVAQGTIGVQVVLGVVVMQNDGREATSLHMFYGFIAFATAGVMYSYRNQVEQWRYLVYGLGGLFLMGLALRSISV